MSVVDPGNIECDLQSGALAGFKVNIESSPFPFERHAAHHSLFLCSACWISALVATC